MKGFNQKYNLYKNEKVENPNKNAIKYIQDSYKEDNYENFNFDNKNLEKQLLEKNSIIKKLQEELDNSKKKVSEFHIKSKALNKKMESLERNLNELDKSNKDLKNNNDYLKSLNEQITKNDEEIRKKNENLYKEIEKYKDINIKLEEKIELINKDLQEKNKQLNDLNLIKIDFEKKIYIYEKEKTKLYGENSKISKELEAKTGKLKETEKSLDETYRELASMKENYAKKELELQNENNKLKESLEINKKELDSNINELNIFHSKYEGAITHFENMDKELKEKTAEIEELKKYKEDNKQKDDRIQILTKAIELNETKEEYLNKPAEEFYDVIVDIKSINSLKNEGWAISYNEKRKEIYNKIIGKQSMKIGVLGLNNVGKSFLLGKIAILNLPSGYSVETKGISIKYAVPKDNDDDEEEEINGICILDSAGYETPLLIEKKNDLNKDEKENESNMKNNDELENAIKYDEIEDELARDKALTERFIEQLIISLSDMLILVIGKLTRTEQRLITRIKNLVKKNDRNKIKSIIIVHNLAQYHKKIEVENYIKQYLYNSATFKLEPRDYHGKDKTFKGREYLFDISDEKIKDLQDIQVYHYIMAKEGTEAGDYYNPFTLELIKQQYNTFNEKRAINIPDKIIELFSELSTEIIGEKMELEKSGKDNNLIIKLKKDNKNEDIKKKKKINVQNTYIDQDGNYLRNRYKFEPKYSLYYYKEKRKEKDEDEDDDEDNDEYDKYLLLRLELPGNIVRLTARSTDLKVEKFKGIVIKGLKKKDDFNEQKKDDFTIISDNRSYAEFSYFIELKRNLELFDSKAKGFTEIYEIQFDKRNKEKAFQNEKNDNQKEIGFKENQNENKKEKKKENKILKIASGVYVMKFLLTKNSFIPNK